MPFPLTPQAFMGNVPQVTTARFDANGEHMHTTQAVLGISDQFTIGIWIKKIGGGSAGDDTYLDFVDQASSTDDRIIFEHDQTNEFRWTIREATGVDKRYRTTGTDFTSNSWFYVVVTLDGTQAAASQMIVYLNASDITGSLTKDSDDDVGGMADRSREVWVANDFSVLQEIDADIYQLQIWDSILTSSEVTALYNSGDPRGLNLLNAIGNYTSHADLLYWYKFTYDRNNFGRDFGPGGNDFTTIAGPPTVRGAVPGDP